MSYFPQHLMQQFSVTERVIFKGVDQTEEERELINNISHDIASQAFAHMKAAREQFAKATRADRRKTIKALLSATDCNLYMEELEKYSFDPFLTTMHFNQKSPLRLQYSLLKSLLTTSF